MMTRFFVVEVFPDMKDDFEKDFSTLSLEMVSGVDGLVQVELLKPRDSEALQYAMITRWENAEAIENLFGKDWRKAVIPEPMQKFAKSHEIYHFESWE